ncbi:MAG: hypothetical protein HYW89_04750 [Candidatus Sungiibacteriota bacterium]|uniref:Cobalamin biosynthesis protein CbiX n=1 Tax=Candidatus Sungiibacteriota bacterium TaxID=2750080 RepID=A0A7T5RJG2_9BACT|nr:MAG: hypothetical protein HYW89_04750 [Candidatus Sungbacteria bacterium]
MGKYKIAATSSIGGLLVFTLLILTLLSGCVKPQEEINDPKLGVLMLAHGGNQNWNKELLKALSAARGNFKRQVVFGMADPDVIQQEIVSLQKEGVNKIVVVPLFLSSHSELYRQLEYVLGIREEPDILFGLLIEHGKKHSNPMPSEHADHTEPLMDIVRRVEFSVPHVIASPINYHPLIASILEERVASISNKENISIVLLAHGPVSETDNKLWLQDLQLYAERMRSKFKNLQVLYHTFRDDAPDFIRNQAIDKIRDSIRQEQKAGRGVIVVPYLLASDGREVAIKEFLADCKCTIIPAALLPHKNISLWIEQQVRRGKIKLAE